jgi:hypothetical protein
MVDVDFQGGWDNLSTVYATATMTFNNFGAYFDFAAKIDADISTSIGLGVFLGENHTVSISSYIN